MLEKSVLKYLKFEYNDIIIYQNIIAFVMIYIIYFKTFKIKIF